jgi:hypothetical protein
MNQDKLREIVLIKAIEESDRPGVVISHPERARATVAALTANGLASDGNHDQVPSNVLAKTISDRASILIEPILAKYPIFDDVIASSRWPVLLAVVVLPLALTSGFGIRWFSDWHRINIMAAPIAGLVIWNVILYLAILISWLSSPLRSNHRNSIWTGYAARFIGRRMRPLVSQTTRVNLILGQAVGRFESGWGVAAGPIIGQQLRRLAHLAGASVGIGLISGFYFFTWDKQFNAGWESTQAAAMVKSLADHCLRPFATWVTIDYPTSVSDFENLSFKSANYISTPALPWVHLLSLFICAIVVVPRLLLAGWASIRIARLERSPHLPECLVAYAGARIGAKGVGLPTTIAVFPYPTALSGATKHRLAAHVAGEFGVSAIPQVQATIPLGNEHLIEKAIGKASETADGLVITCPLHSKPRDRSHGVLLGKAHDRMLSPALGMDLLLLINESWPKPRCMPNWVHNMRRASRKKLWTRFANRYRVEASFLPAG